MPVEGLSFQMIGGALSEVRSLLQELAKHTEKSASKPAQESFELLEKAVMALFGEAEIELSARQVEEAIDTIESTLRASAQSPPNLELASRIEAGLRVVAMARPLAQSFFTETLDELDGKPQVALDEIKRPSSGSPRIAQTPIFIIGCRRSGTTLLSWLLDSHPNITAVPENNLCYSFVRPTVPLDTLERDHPFLVFAQNSVRSLGEERQRFYQRVAELIDGVYSGYAKRNGKARWVDKELFISESLDLLDLIFGYSARYIYIYRHGFDSAVSAATRFANRLGSPRNRSGLDIRTYLQEWIDINEATLDFVERNETRCHRISYEQLVSEPEPAARAIFEFLGEPWSETIFEDMKKQDHHRGLGDNKIYETRGEILSDRRKRWENWPEVLVRQMARRANPTLTRLGYSPFALD